MVTPEAEQILADIESVWASFRAEVAALGEESLARPTVAGWTAKEMLSHVAFWAESVEGFVTTAWRGQPLPDGWSFGSGYAPGDGPWPHFQEHNDREAAWGREHTTQAVLERLDRAHERLVAFVGSISAEEAARDRQYWREVGGHLREHLDELRGVAQLRLTREQLLANVEADWLPFKAAADRLGPEGLERQTTSGWTAKELLGHAAFWDEAAVGAIIGMLRRQPMPPGWRFGSGYVPDPGEWPSSEVHNAREAEWARGQGPAAVLARLELAHSGLTRVLESVTEDELAKDGEYFARLGRHYREHLPELKALL